MTDLVVRCLKYARGIVFRKSFPPFARRIYVFIGTQRGLFLHYPLAFRKRLLHGYYIKNRVERKKNVELLRVVRSNLKYDLDRKPLVSVITPTYNRSKILTERTIPSVLRQTYQNFEMIIVGDNCTDDTETLVRKFNDSRIKFYNLSKRGSYPTDPLYRWMVAGVVPANKALELASGEWIAHLDDDDEFSEDHIELLLNHALENRCEMVYGKCQVETKPGKWVSVGGYPPELGAVYQLTILQHSKLKFFKYDINAWKNEEPDDWNLLRRMIEAGVKIGFANKVVGKHYLERQQWGI
jgi:Glycosyl transferase family 2